MADVKISDLDAATPDPADLLVLVDVSDAAMGPAGSTRRATVADLLDLASAPDLTPYALLAGRAGGQTLVGDTASGGALTLQSTGNATRGRINLGSAGTSYFDEASGQLTVAAAVSAVGQFTTANGQFNSSSGAGLSLAVGGTRRLAIGAQGNVTICSNLSAPSDVNCLAGAEVGTRSPLAVQGVASQSAPLFPLLGQSSTTAGRRMGVVDAAWASSTDASRKGRLTLAASDASGTDREGFRVESDGAAALVGFYGATAQAKPTVTGSRGGNAALASLLAALAALGLLTDSSS